MRENINIGFVNKCKQKVALKSKVSVPIFLINPNVNKDCVSKNCQTMDGGSISQDHCYAEAESEGINYTSSTVKTNQEDEDFTNVEVKLEEMEEPEIKLEVLEEPSLQFEESESICKDKSTKKLDKPSRALKKPGMSYSLLIAEALNDAPMGKLLLQGVQFDI